MSRSDIKLCDGEEERRGAATHCTVNDHVVSAVDDEKD